MDLKGKKVLVLGLARTGRECARFLVSQGASVLVSDLRSEQELKQEMDALGGLPIEYSIGGEDRSWLKGVDFLIPSPGIPAENLLLREAQARAIPILSEIEIAYRFLRAPLAAITGTNGKSTTTTLVGEIFKANETKVFVGGNIGAPLIGFVSGDWDWGVVEISSFQLEWVEEFRPKIAVLLNMTEDHLDRYANFAAYCRAKERIFEAQNRDDVAVLNRDDPLVWRMKERIAARVISFGFSEVPEGIFAAADEIIWREGSREEKFPLRRVKIQGVHNVENMMAAIAVAKAAGIEGDLIQKTLEGFSGLEHRLEFVREINGVQYYNDSKGTNVGAVAKSLASFPGPVILLAGGVDKGGDYAPLQDEIKRKVRRLVLFGEAKNRIAGALGYLTETVKVDSLEAAVRDAAKRARPGDVVLLSPACSSFDMFKNYAERGKVFKSLVHAL
jgi:UDP-N-acetylmuramoylalanine--D-glutamate ligase